MGELDFFMNDRMKVLQIIYQHQISVEGNSFCPLNQQEIADLVPVSYTHLTLPTNSLV